MATGNYLVTDGLGGELLVTDGLGGTTSGTAGTLYYVGGGPTAIWSDTYNWSLTSGGLGGAGVPTIVDDVIFDQNSLRNCTLTATSICKSITFSTYTNILYINGQNLTLDGGVSATPSIIVGGTINLGTGNIIVKAYLTLKPTSVVYTTGTWTIDMNLDTILITVGDSEVNVGNITIIGDDTNTCTVTKDTATGILVVNSILSDQHLTIANSTDLKVTSLALSNCTFGVSNTCYFNGQVVFNNVTMAVYGTYYIIASGNYSFNNATFPNLSTDQVAPYIINLLQPVNTSGTMKLYPDNRVVFNTTGTYAFNTIDWSGTNNNLIRLSGLGIWSLDVTVAPTVAYVAVTQSDASLGEQIDASDGTSVDNGSNTNWLFHTPVPVSSSSYTVIERTVTETVEPTRTGFVPESKIEKFLYNPPNLAPNYLFNRGFAQSGKNMEKYENLQQQVIFNNNLGMIKYPGVIDQS